MKTPRTRLAAAIADRALNKGGVRDLSKEVAAYLLSEGRVRELDSILRDVQADWAQAGYIEVLASSAHPLTEAIKADIERQVRNIYPNAKRLLITEVRDPDVVGGVRLNLANQQLDLSVEAKINKLKQLTQG